MKTTFFVDIDQTISTGHVGQDLAESVQYYRDLGLTVPEGVICWPDLFQLPEVVRMHEVFPCAPFGVKQLTTHGNVFYATARTSAVFQITHEWLSVSGFPFPEQVIFCSGVSEKLLAIAAHPGSLVLIDDRWRQLLGILETYGEHRVLRSLRDRLTLVAFGVQALDLPESSVVPVVPLPDWSRITELLELFPMSVVSHRKDVV